MQNLRWFNPVSSIAWYFSEPRLRLCKALNALHMGEPRMK